MSVSEIREVLMATEAKLLNAAFAPPPPPTVTNVVVSQPSKRAPEVASVSKKSWPSVQEGGEVPDSILMPAKSQSPVIDSDALRSTRSAEVMPPNEVATKTPAVVNCAEPVQASNESGVTARVASVPVFVSAPVASSTIPTTVTLAVSTIAVAFPVSRVPTVVKAETVDVASKIVWPPMVTRAFKSAVTVSAEVMVRISTYTVPSTSRARSFRKSVAVRPELIV